jgi:hypothetical protein
MSVSITPETKIAELLDAYPHLEEVLLQQSPHFKHLKNPILRKTVAKVATLEKAAQMGGIPLRQLIATLRQAAGLPVEHSTADHGTGGRPTGMDGPVPDWLDEAKVTLTIDADRLLESGQVPLSLVHQAIRELTPGQLLCVVSSFNPAPLLEALAKAGHQVYVRQVSPEAFRTYVLPAW